MARVCPRADYQVCLAKGTLQINIKTDGTELRPIFQPVRASQFSPDQDFCGL
jgi:hypothetical protein